jgi:hypothetical protein
VPLRRGCPAWEYNGLPQRQAVLTAAAADLLADLMTAAIDSLAIACDTRPAHERLFRQLTPPGVDYYAGHYRGEAFYCLEEYTVQVPHDPRVGAPPDRVASEMAQMSSFILQRLLLLDIAVRDPKLTAGRRVQLAVAIAACVFELFLRIHPYANGNGHAARFCVWAILGRYGLWPRKWPIEPRPTDPPYTPAIVEYRNGNAEPLETMLLHCILGTN